MFNDICADGYLLHKPTYNEARDVIKLLVKQKQIKRWYAPKLLLSMLYTENNLIINSPAGLPVILLSSCKGNEYACVTTLSKNIEYKPCMDIITHYWFNIIECRELHLFSDDKYFTSELTRNGFKWIMMHTFLYMSSRSYFRHYTITSRIS